jgi:hypothetical protein
LQPAASLPGKTDEAAGLFVRHPAQVCQQIYGKEVVGTRLNLSRIFADKEGDVHR